MKYDPTKPIGVFDSGLGGLTVARAIRELLPRESMIYFGDTAHLPYGDKSAAAIQAYSIKICDLLLQRGCKLIVIACNSASSAAYDLIKEYVGSRAKVLNVIDPMVNYVHTHYSGKRVGLIGTRLTISSNIYEKKLAGLNSGIELCSLATPMLVPMIEEGFYQGKIAAEVIEEYLADPALANIEALILGCTHYPLIQKAIETFYDRRVDVISSSAIMANAIQSFLSFHGLLNLEQEKAALLQFYLSDYTNSFVQSAKRFFCGDLTIEHYPLWE